jgi:hypothetical protein
VVVFVCTSCSSIQLYCLTQVSAIVFSESDSAAAPSTVLQEHSEFKSWFYQENELCAAALNFCINTVESGTYGTGQVLDCQALPVVT